ncbi:MAG TPA: DUF2059 domain-containing protein [Thermoanaerobaculia bacterium]|nr:DUF2059 domain-containing protein [Thermoanaerobaculia bacterium]
MTVFLLGLSPSAAWGVEVSSVHRQAAVELLQMMDLEKTMRSTLSAMLDAQINGNPEMAPYRDVFQSWIERYFSWDALKPRMIDLYVQAFTEPELRDMIAFYKTPTGQKSLTKLPALMQQGGQLGAEIVQQHKTELEKMMRARKHELDEAKQKPKSETAPPEPSGKDPLDRANRFFDSKSWNQAAEAYAEYLKSAPGNLDAMTDLGICYRELTNYEGALRQFDSVLALDSHHWKAMYNKVIVLAFDLKRKDEAEKLLAKLQGLQPDNADVKNLQEAVDKL